MGRYARRLFVALVISSSCFGATVAWYYSGLEDRGNGGTRTPVALLQEHTNDVQRKPLARVIWESITKNENLYTGEAIRTTATSEARLLFIKTGTLIELEPNSLVVLEETENGIALDFLKGNLFVKGGTGDSQGGLKLKTGAGEIDLSKADVSLSKSQEGGAVDLEVLKGTASLTKGGQTITLDKTKSGLISDSGLQESISRIHVLSPLPSDPIYIDARKERSILIEWEKLSPGYRVFVERGTQREILARYETVSSPGESGQIRVPQGIGKMFFRLVGVPADPEKPELSSKVMGATVIAKAPPVLLEPENDATAVLKPTSPKLKVRWAARTQFDSMVIELARDQQLKNKFAQENLEPQATSADINVSEGGTFFVRLTGFMKIRDKLEPISSEVQKIHVKLGVDLVPPVLKSPTKDQSLSFQQVQISGLFLSWEPVPGIEKYKVVIAPTGKEQETIERTVADSPLRMADLAPGTYTWSVTSMDSEGKPSTPSEKRHFRVEEMPRVEWANGSEAETYYYFSARPSLGVDWKKNSESIASWQYRVGPPGALADLPWLPSSKPTIKEFVPQAGDYEVEVEALNARGATVARSNIKVIRVREKPLLAAPIFAKSLPPRLQSTKSGQVEITWEEVQGARKYKLEILDQEGKVAVTKVVERNIASMDRLKPGDYSVVVRAVDEHERPSEASEAKPLNVPNVSGIRAPSLKKIEVK